ncbi:PepSY-associated TM helix domain-containing protein [Aeromonas salmonicida]|uniref:PepSY-associated TM helix domain-containing protein n=1 Tax=Aeromonas salmonicida TaxID=645 RepID=UPI00286389F8|nr:PepSY domain-containing protein [Aeromonas salmonicida]MDR7020368.1 putative iron-regulated membrane protein [Aeromonas salmonicida]
MKNRASSHYQRIWRWHFYAGLFVAPFLILLSLTGIVYLFKPQLDNLLYPELMKVPPAAHILSADQLPGKPLGADALWAKARATMPDANLSKYLPPAAPDLSAQFIVTQQGNELTLFMDPVSGTLLGTMDNKWNLQAVARALHADLLLGTTGDRLIELAAGWGIVLLVSGLYLWWPRKGPGVGGILWPRLNQRGRLWWRDLHAVVGFWGAGFLLLLLLSGMTWTGFWGAQFADLWNRFPAAMWNEVPKSAPLVRNLNHSHEQTVPWAVETMPMPSSQPAAKRHDHSAMHQGGEQDDIVMASHRIPLQQVVEIAQARQVSPGYSITPPVGESGVYTIALFADDPRNDATLHIDQYSGKVLADVRWQDYGPVAKTVETGVMLHMGKLYGWPHQIAMLVICLMVLLSSVSGLWIWWSRRPQGRLAAPPLPAKLPPMRGAIALLILLGIAFPLVGASMLVIWLLDSLFFSRRAPRLVQAS